MPCLPGRKRRLSCGQELGELLLGVVEALAEVVDRLVPLRDPGLQVGASPPVGGPPPRPGLGQLSLEPPQHQPFFVAVPPGLLGCAAGHAHLQPQWALRLQSRLVHPAEQVAGAGAARLLGQLADQLVGDHAVGQPGQVVAVPTDPGVVPPALQPKQVVLDVAGRPPTCSQPALDQLAPGLRLHPRGVQQRHHAVRAQVLGQVVGALLGQRLHQQVKGSLGQRQPPGRPAGGQPVGRHRCRADVDLLRAPHGRRRAGAVAGHPVDPPGRILGPCSIPRAVH